VVSGQASRGRESAGVALSVARAFQPEICPLRLDRLAIVAQGRVILRAVCLTEAAKVSGQSSEFRGQNFADDQEEQ
jgi:hypothetical protein